MLCIWAIFGMLGALMAYNRNRNRSVFGGMALGFLLGLIGLAIIALMGDKH